MKPQMLLCVLAFVWAAEIRVQFNAKMDAKTVPLNRIDTTTAASPHRPGHMYFHVAPWHEQTVKKNRYVKKDSRYKIMPSFAPLLTLLDVQK